MLKILLPDIHIPIHHVKAVAAVLEFIGQMDPDEVHQQGDLLDAASVSRWARGTINEKNGSLQRELDALDKFWEQLRAVYGGKVSLIEDANHDRRIQMYAESQAHAFAGLRALDTKTLFHLDKYDVQLAKAPYKIAPGVISIHGTHVRAQPGASVLAEMDKYDSSVVMGHVHRAAVVYRPRGAAGTRAPRFGLEGGCLIDARKADYLGSGSPNNWQLGISLLWIDGKDVHPEFVPISDKGVLHYQGIKYTG